MKHISSILLEMCLADHFSEECACKLSLWIAQIVEVAGNYHCDGDGLVQGDALLRHKVLLQLRINNTTYEQAEQDWLAVIVFLAAAGLAAGQLHVILCFGF